MNQDLAQIVMYYATKPHKELSELILSKSKDNLISILTDLLTSYINDRNSSTLREFVTVSIAGYEHHTQKLGYNGFKQNSTIGGKPIACEAKPKNIQTEGYDAKKSKPKLNAEGSFNDYHGGRLESDMKENPFILSSGFVDGHLLYILEFPFAILRHRLSKLIEKRFGADVRPSGEYIRSASFNFSHYKDSGDLKIIYRNKEAIESNKKYFNRDLYLFLLK